MSILRFNFTLCFDVDANALRKYIYVCVCVCLRSRNRNEFIQFPDPISVHNVSSIFHDMSRMLRITAQRNRIRLDFEIRNVSLRLVTDHEDRVHECTRDDNIKMHERAFSRRVGMFLTREAQFVARFTQITARILPCSARDHVPKSIYSISKMYNGYANTYLSSLSLFLPVSISI